MREGLRSGNPALRSDKEAVSPSESSDKRIVYIRRGWGKGKSKGCDLNEESRCQEAEKEGNVYVSHPDERVDFREKDDISSLHEGVEPKDHAILSDKQRRSDISCGSRSEEKAVVVSSSNTGTVEEDMNVPSLKKGIEIEQKQDSENTMPLPEEEIASELREKTVELAENARKRSWPHEYENSKESSVPMKKKKTVNRQKYDGAKNQKMQSEAKMEESDPSADHSRNEVQRVLKEPGRHPKVQVELETVESDQSDSDSIKRLKQRHGKRRGKKHGVPQKSQHTDNVLMMVDCDKENLHETLTEKKSVLRSRDFKGNKCGDVKMGGNASSIGSRSKTKTASCSKEMGGNLGSLRRKKELEGGQRRAIQQAVRDRIVELLLGAGWTIEYRPRNGRAYADAVYVNPEKRTHWSVTLAYRVLKKSYENGIVNSESSKKDFIFTPIPDEELSVLKKVMSKERSDKNRPKKKMKINKTDGGATHKKHDKQRRSTMKMKIKKAAEMNIGKMLNKRMLYRRKLQKEKQSPIATKSLTRDTSDSSVVMPRLVRNRKCLETLNQNRCALMVRNSEGVESESDGYVLHDGKQTVLSWMIDMGVIPINAKVQFLNLAETTVMSEGKVIKDGIHCNCCGGIFTVTEFQIHSGSADQQTSGSMYLESGCSLLQCQLDSWNKQDGSESRRYHYVDINGEDPNDDTCGICGDGGDLICCDGCPSTFHKSCLDIKKFPSGVWCCLYCSCKFCGMVSGNSCQRDDITAASLSALKVCCLCEEKYHDFCAQATITINDASRDDTFCGKNCQELYGKLQSLLGIKHDLGEGFSWTLLRCFDVGSGSSLDDASQKIECNSKLAVALHIMDECFLPISDHRSGVNLMRNIVYNYGSNFKRLDYSGFVTAILEKGDEIVGAASIRIHGKQLAEMPFIGTRYVYRRQGMCRRLLSGIESALCSLDIDKLVIPAVSELTETWTSVFGFKPVEVPLKKKLRSLSMLVFPGLDMLQKPMSRLENAIPATQDPLCICPEDQQPRNRNEGKDGETATLECVSSSPASPSLNGASHITVAALESVPSSLGCCKQQPLVLLPAEKVEALDWCSKQSDTSVVSQVQQCHT